MGLREYRKKRNFRKTAEPAGRKKKPTSKSNRRSFVIQKHDASHLHYDFRLELDGVLKSWAVPKGPSLDPKEKRLAVEVEDHPLDYASFEGEIPEGEYGGGDVIVWDRGEWISSKTPAADLKKGRLEFELVGEKLRGKWILIRTGRSSSKPQWLLMKRTDSAARLHEKFDVVEKMPESVITGGRLPRDSGTAGVVKGRKAARAAKFPGFIRPQLAKLSEAVPISEGWVHELKFDGYRAVTTLQKGKVKIFTRSGLDWTAKYRAVAKALKKIKATDAILDGEIVAMDHEGRSDFSTLQLALKENQDVELVYFVFDLLWLEGKDLRDLPLLERKKLLEKLIQRTKDDALRYSEHWSEDGPSMLKAACGLKMEGIISKRVDAEYESTRSGSWLKTKCSQGQEFVIGGYTQPKGSRHGFGALLLGAKDENGKLRYVGRVGTGFDAKFLTEMRAKFKSRERSTSPFQVASPKGKDITFIKPDLVAQVKFAEWTSDGILRHPSFEGLREDKKAAHVVIEKRSIKKSSRSQLTHPDKLLYPDVGISKDLVATYYERVSKLIMPHLRRKPIAMVRCPDGAGSECFFQKKLGFHKGKELKTAKVRGRKGKNEELVYLEKKEGLTELVQMGVLEIHAWGATVDEITKPDLIVFDLDPEESVKFDFVKQTAIKIRDLLADMGLKSFVKTTGGKGLHVHVPIVPEHDYDQVKAFSLAVVRHLEKGSPRLYTTQIMKNKRHGRIFLDYLRNGYGATAIVPYSLRSKSDATAAVPVTWSELAKLKSASALKMADVEKRIAKVKDPWVGYFKVRQRLKLK